VASGQRSVLSFLNTTDVGFILPGSAVHPALPMAQRRYNRVMSFLRYLMFLSLMVWIGGLIFFAFVLAPTVFNIPEVLPNTHLAGNVVGRALGKLHWIGIISGLVFLVSSLVYSYIGAGAVEALTARNVLICLMLTITLISQFGIVPRMDGLRASLGETSSAAGDNLARIQFDALHAWSTRLESAVLLLGLVVVYLLAARS
jgi:uncharacterized membrane protein